MKNIMFTILISLTIISCGITPANIDSKTPVASTFFKDTTDSVIPCFIAKVETTYPFKHYEISEVRVGDLIRVSSFDLQRGSIMWTSFGTIGESKPVDIYISKDIFWDANELGIKLKSYVDECDA